MNVSAAALRVALDVTEFALARGVSCRHFLSGNGSLTFRVENGTHLSDDLIDTAFAATFEHGADVRFTFQFS